MKRLEAGMLCLVVGCVSRAENLGKTVMLIRYITLGEITTDGFLYVDHSGGWEVRGDGLVDSGGVFGTRAIFDKDHLMPLKGDFTDETVEEQQELTV